MTLPRSHIPVALAAALYLVGQPVAADHPPEPQPQMTISGGYENTVLLDWQGVTARTYFLQFSLDLQDWFYAPFMAFGTDLHQFGAAADTPRLFFRLVYADVPGITSLEEAMLADFDGDGLSNMFEVMHGMDPFSADMDTDGDEDGLLLSNEQLYGTSPHRRDNPAVKLNVLIGN